MKTDKVVYVIVRRRERGCVVCMSLAAVARELSINKNTACRWMEKGYHCDSDIEIFCAQIRRRGS